MRYALLLSLAASTAVLAAPLAGNAWKVPRQLEDLTGILGTDSTTSPTDVTTRSEEADEEDYIVQGPDYENASNDLLASLFDPGYGDDGSESGTPIKRTEPTVKQDEYPDDGLSLVSDLTHLDLSDLTG